MAPMQRGFSNPARLLRWRDIYREAELYKAAVRVYTKPLFLWRKALHRRQNIIRLCSWRFERFGSDPRATPGWAVSLSPVRGA